MLLVDHDMGLVLSICDYLVVLEFGRVIAQGKPDVVRRDPQVIAAYLGGSASSVDVAGVDKAPAENGGRER
jgi:branched-chain amino acid transport system ATP-binding protein